MAKLNKNTSKKKIAVIGAGISGLSIAKMLDKYFVVKVFEKENNAGGLIKCKYVDGNLFHLTGGHVFNSKNKQVFEWFKQYFNINNEFTTNKRNASIYLNEKFIGYPIENHLWQLPEVITKRVVKDLLNLPKNQPQNIEDIKNYYKNFADFLRNRFGNTLYDIYFKPYNEKIWHTDLSKIALRWLQGKLPMPNSSDILLKNILRTNEKQMVHSSFYYPKIDGSQFIIDKLSERLNIDLDTNIEKILKKENQYLIDNELFDKIIYTGDIRKLMDIFNFENDWFDNIQLTDFKSNGTTNMLCTIQSKTDLTWLYFPEVKYKPHRIIFTGNFSENNNNSNKKISCVVEYSGKITEIELKEEISKLPMKLKPIAFNFTESSYIIHKRNNMDEIKNLKNKLEQANIYLLGRFAEWQYYNMDKCIESAMKLSKKITNEL